MDIVISANGDTIENGISDNCSHAFTFIGDFGGGTLTLKDGDGVVLTDEPFTAQGRRGVFYSSDTRSITYTLAGATAPSITVKRKRIGYPNQV